MSETLEAQLIRHEGLRLDMYKCPADEWTIGVGHNLSRPISKKAALVILGDDIDDCRTDLYRLLSDEITELPAPAVQVLLNMCFNLGITRLRRFKKMLAAIRSSQWDLAADELLDSAYARQVGQRAVELSEMLRKLA